MTNRRMIAVAVAAALSGCITGALPVHQPDNTPTNPTVVSETYTDFGGILGFFPYQSTARHYVRTTARRDESTFKGTGAISGFIVGSRTDASIMRPDRDLIWRINDEKKEYTECPLFGGCPRPSQPEKKPAEPKPQQPEAKHEPGCTMKIAGNTFNVTPTGQKRNINGFDTDEYKVAWIVTFQDGNARKSTSSLNVDVWTTPISAALREIFAIEDAFSRSLAKSVTKNLTNQERSQVLPPDVMKAITGYLSRSLGPNETSAFANAARQMEKIKGHPISTRIEWDFKGNACAANDGDSASKNSPPPSPAAALSALSGLFGQKKPDDGKAAADKPVITVQIDVKTLKLQPEHDSLFVVPPGYKKIDPR
jgi:hypothetical protein